MDITNSNNYSNKFEDIFAKTKNLVLSNSIHSPKAKDFDDFENHGFNDNQEKASTSKPLNTNLFPENNVKKPPSTYSNLEWNEELNKMFNKSLHVQSERVIKNTLTPNKCYWNFNDRSNIQIAQEVKFTVYTGGLECRNPLPEITLPKLYLNMAEKCLIEQKTDKTFVELKIFKDKCLMQKVGNLDEFVQLQSHINLFAWATEVIESKENAYLGAYFELIFIKTKKYFKTKIQRSYTEKNDIRNTKSVQVKLSANKLEKEYIIGEIKDYNEENGELLIRFRGKNKSIEIGESYDIIFQSNSLVYLSRHRTLIELEKQEKKHLLFPEFPKKTIPKLEFVRAQNEKVQQLAILTNNKLNDLQKIAVIGILRSENNHIPYVLFGPPGTGKTTTLVEAVAHLLNNSQENKILICTPSNMASNHFAYSLLKTKILNSSQIFRMFAFSKKVENEDEKMKPIIFTVPDVAIEGGEKFGIPKKSTLLKCYRIVISTLAASTYLVNGDLKGAFSHIIVDEAGQAQEIETLIPIVGLGNENTRIILAGDPKQLGPVQTNNLLKNCGIDKSLLQHYIDIASYNDMRFMCMLRQNYRAHPALVDIASEMCYDGQLISSLPIFQCNTLCQWKRLPKKDFPLIWHSIYGKEEREQEGTSYYNNKEIEQVILYIEYLITETDVKPQQIGIISPYKYQAKKIRSQIDARWSGFDQLVVDSVERFQGSERRVIIISTVRTESLGFLRQIQRLNTSITRAQELLIIIGNDFVLSADENWRRLYDYCVANGAKIESLKNPNLVPIQKPRKNLDDVLWE